MNRVDRLMGYLLMFQSRGKVLRAQDFAAHFEISERTVYRDIQALSEVGVPIIATPGEGYQLMEGYYLPPITFSTEEARALFLAVSMLDGFTEDGATKTAVSNALEKIKAILPEATKREAEALQAILQFYAFPTPPISFDNHMFIQLQQAIYEHQVVQIHYHAQHTNKVTKRNIEPVQFTLLDKAWMLTAYCRLRKESRVFRIDRIDKITVRDEHFIPRDLDDQSRSRGDLKITLRVHSTIKRWVRERQHFSFVDESTIESKTGDVLMHYQPKTFTQIVNWILQWGAEVEVVEPSKLRAQIKTITQQVNTLY